MDRLPSLEDYIDAVNLLAVTNWHWPAAAAYDVQHQSWSLKTNIEMIIARTAANMLNPRLNQSFLRGVFRSGYRNKATLYSKRKAPIRPIIQTPGSAALKSVKFLLLLISGFILSLWGRPRWPEWRGRRRIRGYRATRRV